MVHIVHADIAGTPTQNAWQSVMRASIEGRILHVPVFLEFPDSVFELMLDGEKPHPRDRGQ